MFFGNFVIDPRSSIARRQLSMTLYIAIWHLASLFPRDDRVTHVEKHIVDGQAFYDICRANVRETRTGKDIVRRTFANSQVRQLGSTCNLIFTVVGTVQTWTLLSYSLRYDDAFIPNHRFYQKRRPHGSLNPEKRPFFQRVAHEFIVYPKALVLFLIPPSLFPFLRLNFDENAKNTRRSKRSIREPI